MGAKLDLDLIYSVNLFFKITGVSTKYCFRYNNWLIFVVPPHLIPKALGQKGENVHKMGRLLKCKVKVIPESSLEPFVKAIIYPVKFKKLVAENDEITIIAGPNSKASLIGRDKIRLEELSGILKDFFSIRSLKIV
ncbi:MAG: hypothetical protein KKE23_00300 [Nanoarchaeota archaeon]|nr:hypothetical protein [Nanoarchaeota archaeon]